MLGSIIPEPFDMPVICDLTPLNLKLLVTPFGKVSVVIIALAEFNQSLFGNLFFAIAERIFLMGYGSPITPVEHRKNLLTGTSYWVDIFFAKSVILLTPW